MTKQHTTEYSSLPPIVAVDFDGTLVTDEFPNIGVERERMCKAIRKIQELGIKTILWTSRTGEYLDAAVEWCQTHNLKFDAVNENIREVQELTGEDTRKVYANVYIDDKNREANGALTLELTKGLFSWLGK